MLFSQNKRLAVLEKLLIEKQEEIEQMLGLSELEQTRVYQEAKLEGKIESKIEGKLEAVPFMLSLGATVEQIAQALGLDIEQVRLVAQSTQPN